MDRKGIAISLVIGIILATVSGVIPNGVESGATLYGFPFTWRVQIMNEPEVNPWITNYFMLAADILLWGLIVSTVVEYIQNRKKL
jgi:hypothetical protein